MVDQSKEAMQQVFKSIDKDNSGFLDPQEIAILSKELGKELSDAEINQIFAKIDTNHDGKLSFEEFYTWWLYGQSNQLEALVYFKLKAMKLIQKAQVQLHKVGGLLSNKHEQGSHNSYVAVQIGDAPPKTTAGIRILFGQEAKLYNQEIFNGLNEINQDLPAIIIKIRCIDQDIAIQKFKGIFEQLVILAESMLPPEIAEQFVPHMKFSFAKPDPNYISIGISCEHEILKALSNQILTIHPDLNSDDVNSSFSVKYNSPIDGNTLANKTDSNLVDILAHGFNLEFEFRTNNILIEKVKQIIFKEIEKGLENNVHTKKFKTLCRLVPFYLSNGLKAVLRFRKFEDLQSFEQFGGVGILMPLKALLLQVNAAQMIKEMPLLEEAISTLKTHCSSDFSISLVNPRVCKIIYLQSEGYSKVVDFLLSE